MGWNHGARSRIPRDQNALTAAGVKDTQAAGISADGALAARVEHLHRHAALEQTERRHLAHRAAADHESFGFYHITSCRT
jgi:hypothetical protein